MTEPRYLSIVRQLPPETRDVLRRATRQLARDHGLTALEAGHVAYWSAVHGVLPLPDPPPCVICRATDYRVGLEVATVGRLCPRCWTWH